MRHVTLAGTLLVLTMVALPVSAEPGPVELRPVVVQLVDTHPNPSALAQALIRQHGGEPGLIYEHAIRGFSANLPGAAIQALRNNPNVVRVASDKEYSITASQLDIPSGYDRIQAGQATRTSVVTDVDIAILDTGVRLYHPDLNVVQATDCTSGCTGSGSLDDGNGHGTHVSGIAAAYDNGIGTTGIAPGARIWSVKVLDSQGLGLLSWIIGGVDIVTAYADQIDVANMSLAGEFSEPMLDDAIASSVAAGVTYVVAAGNSAQDASTFSPASNEQAITVSAIADGDGAAGGLGAFACRDDQTDDTFATFSNYGAVDIAAPGVCNYSTWNDDGYKVLSGTSMAAPHVTGAVALYIAEQGRDRNGDQVTDETDVALIKAAILNDATPQSDACGFTGDPDQIPEPLLFLNGSAFGGDGSCTTAIPDATGPTATTVSATSGGFTVGLSWLDSEDPESGVLSYVLERDGLEIAELDAHTTNYNDTDVSPGTTYAYSVTPKNRQGVVGQPAGDSATTSSGDPTLEGWWSLDDGSGNSAADSSGWSRHASLVNGPAWTEGVDQGGLALDGVDDRLDLDPVILDGADDVTAAFWMRTTETGPQSIISGANPGNNNEYLIYLSDDTHLHFYVGTSTTGAGEWTIPSIADGLWHHIAVVRSSVPEHIYLYLDGSYHGGFLVSPPMVPLEIDGLVVGQDQDSVMGGFDPNQALFGDLDDVRLYSRVLTSEEIAALAVAPSSNTNPVAADDAATGDEDTQINVDVLANDTDDDGDALTVVSVTQPANGSSIIDIDGTVTYSPNADFYGADAFTYTIDDGNGGFATGNVAVTVNPVNDAPVADAGSDQTATVGIPATLDGSASYDVDGDPLTFVWSITSAPSGSQASLDDPGATTPQLTPDIAGDYTVQLTVNDGSVDSAPDVATITANDPPNNPPVASDDSYSTLEDSTLSVAIPGVLQNDSDLDGDSLSVTSNTQPTNGSVTLSAAGSFDYTPSPDFYGSDTFSYEVSDGVATDIGTVTITVDPVNDAPIASDDVGSVAEDSSATLDVLSTDSDVEGSALLVTNLTQPSSGSVVVNPDQTLTYTPSQDFNGSDSFTYTANDGDLDSNVATVNITVDPVNDAPVADAGSDQTATVGIPATLDGSASYDVDGDPLTFVWSITSAPSGSQASLDDPGATTPQLTPDIAGDYTVQLTVNDGSVDSAPDAVVLSAVENSVQQFALSESTLLGSRTGDLTLTYSSDGVYEELTEEHSGGRPSLRQSFLEHEWTLDIQPGDLVSVSVEAFHSLNSESDDFVFELSTDGGASYQPLFVVTATGTPALYQATIPAATSGVVIVRATDTDQTIGSGSTDTLYVDLLVIETINPQAPPPEEGVTADSETSVQGSVISGDYLSTHTADGYYEVIQEEQYAGQKRSRLEHHWTFNTSGSNLTFYLTADQLSPINETFTFAYSTDGSSWTDMTGLALDGLQHAFSLPAGATGTIHVRVIDNDRSRNESSIDTVRIDEMYFQAG